MTRYAYILIITIFISCCTKAGTTGPGDQPEIINSKKYRIETGVALENLLDKLLPGDTVLFAEKNWNNEQLIIDISGKPGAPVVFMGEVPGKTIFTGNSTLKIAGDYLVICDIAFHNGVPTASGSIIEFRSGTREASYCRLTNVSILNYNPVNKDLDTKWISLYGTHNRVDHCSLTGKFNAGATFVVWLDAIPDYHIIDHNYFGPRPSLGVNGGETIRIGTSDWERYSSNCIVEYNLFEACDGEIEIISSKSVGNIYRYNNFTNCEGTLTLRHGSDCLVYGNFFFGNLNKNCGGIRLIGPGHIVYNNYLENLTGTEYRAAICLANGVPNSPANRYRQVENATVGYNTIINCREPFAIGAGKDSEKSLAPINSQIENNIIISAGNYPVVKTYDSATGVTFKGNLTDASTIGVSPSTGFLIATLPMARYESLIRPIFGNPAKDASVSGRFDTLSSDIDGHVRPAIPKDVGSDQVSNNPVIRKPVTRNEAGTSY